MRPSICVLLGTLKPPAIDKGSLGRDRPRTAWRTSLKKRGALSPAALDTRRCPLESCSEAMPDGDPGQDACLLVSAGTPPAFAVLGDAQDLHSWPIAAHLPLAGSLPVRLGEGLARDISPDSKYVL